MPNPPLSLQLDFLSECVISYADVLSISSKIDIAIDNIYKAHTTHGMPFVDKHFDSLFANGLKQVLSQTNVSLADVLHTVKSELNSYSRANLTLSFLPSNEFLHKLKLKTRPIFSSKFYFFVNVDPSICGGFILAYNGIYYDKTLIKLVEGYYNNL